MKTHKGKNSGRKNRDATLTNKNGITADAC